jgi:hypothetical protein
MEPEDQFLDNASTMVRYAKEEIKQFLAWTNKQPVYGQSAEAIVSKLESVLGEIKELEKQYNKR